MKATQPLTLNLHGRLMDLSRPRIMGIINVTPDSFYVGSRHGTDQEISARLRAMVEEGVDIIDLGGYSSRPGAEDVSAEEEYSRICSALEVVRRDAPEIPVSVDTFRSSVGRRCVEEWKVDIINDIGGGTLDPEMWNMVADSGCAYVLMHMRGNPATMQGLTGYGDVVAEVLEALAFGVAELHRLGVADVIVDPGFGFAKTREQNFRLLDMLEIFGETGCPVLAGISRKSMITDTLGITASEALNGTSVLNTIALMKGASILRVHDVKEAREAADLFEALRKGNQ